MVFLSPPFIFMPFSSHLPFWFFFFLTQYLHPYLKSLICHCCVYLLPICVITNISAYTGEGNGNPLQHSCLENPRDRGAWWAAVYGFAQSRTQLKRLSSSRSTTFTYTTPICYIIFFRQNISNYRKACRVMWEMLCPIVYVGVVSHVQLFATLKTVACQALMSLGFSSQEYWSELPCPPPGYLPDPGIQPTSFMSPALVGRFFTTSNT